MKHRAGVTLLELLVVMAIVLIITAASLPAFMSFTNTARLRAGARDITTALRSARRLAITSRIDRSVTIYFDNYPVDSDKNSVSFYESENTIELERAASNIYFADDIPYTGAVTYLTFTFNARGTTQSDSIYAVDADNRYIQVAVQGITGRVSTKEIQQ